MPYFRQRRKVGRLRQLLAVSAFWLYQPFLSCRSLPVGCISLLVASTCWLYQPLGCISLSGGCISLLAASAGLLGVESFDKYGFRLQWQRCLCDDSLPGGADKHHTCTLIETTVVGFKPAVAASWLYQPVGCISLVAVQALSLIHI